jgi:hypothetical protein
LVETTMVAAVAAADPRIRAVLAANLENAEVAAVQAETQAVLGHLRGIRVAAVATVATGQAETQAVLGHLLGIRAVVVASTPALTQAILAIQVTQVPVSVVEMEERVLPAQTLTV